MPPGTLVNGKPLHSLRFFMNRSAVLARYREFLRATSPLDPATKHEVRKQIREGFESQRHVHDEHRVMQLLRQSHTQLAVVQNSVDSAIAKQYRLQQPEKNSCAQKNLELPTKRPQTANPVVHAVPNAAAGFGQHNTWMTTDETLDDDNDDIKGRVGTNWPWKRRTQVRKLDMEGMKR